MDWNSFWSSLLGTAVPAFITAIVALVLTHRTNKALEAERGRFSQQLARLEGEITARSSLYAFWNEKRAEALVRIYDAFCAYLDFVRRVLYVPSNDGQSMDPMWEFRASLEKNLVFLNTDLEKELQTIAGELLVFWNWAHEQDRAGAEQFDDPVQRRLNFEIPKYLDRIRALIRNYLESISIASP